MSSSSYTDVTLGAWTIGAVGLLDHLLSIGWQVPFPLFGYRPCMDDDEDVTWESAKTCDFRTVRAIIEKQQALGQASAIELRQTATGYYASFDFKPRTKLIRVGWGADNPRHPNWDRITDPSWAMNEIKAIIVPVQREVCSLEMWFIDPY